MKWNKENSIAQVENLFAVSGSRMTLDVKPEQCSLSRDDDTWLEK